MPTALDKRPDILRFGSDGWQARYDKGFTRDNVVRLAEALGTVLTHALKQIRLLLKPLQHWLPLV